MPIKVMIADDHSVVREGVRALLARWSREITVSGEASDGKGLLELARKTPADVYVLDIAMPGLNGIETAARLLRLDKNAKIIYLSMYNDRPTVQKALEAGARGYLLKGAEPEEIERALRTVAGGSAVLAPRIAEHVLGRVTRRPAGESLPELTAREHDVLT